MATLTVEQRLDDDPRYIGTIHDDAVARARGFRAALVPGAFLYGHVSRLALASFGPEWLARGALATRFRRPVFNGDTLTVAAAPAEPGARAPVTISSADGEAVADGWIAMGEAAPAAGLAPPDAPQEPTAVVEGAVVGSPERVLGAEEVARSRRAFAEEAPVYAAEGIVHSGCLMRIAMSDAYRCLRLPEPPVLAAVEGQHFRPVRAGERIAMVGRVRRVFERNGRHYFETEEHVLASGAPAARFLRTTLMR